MSVTVDPPVSLPVDYLSLSSLKLFQQCPLRWYRRYVCKEYEPPSGKMVLGSAAGAALTQHYGLQIETGQGMACEQVLDEFAGEWEERVEREEVDWKSDTPGELKDSGAAALSLYHRTIAPQVQPLAVEREIQLSWPGVDWGLTMFLDLEDAQGRVRDYKMTAKRISQKDADADLQPTVYLAGCRAEGDPASEFIFDTMVRTKTPVAEPVSTQRTDAQLDHLTDRVFTLAREIDWRCETGDWSGAAPNTWFCSTCGFTDCAWRL